MGHLKGRGRNEEQTVKSTGLMGEEHQDADKTQVCNSSSTVCRGIMKEIAGEKVWTGKRGLIRMWNFQGASLQETPHPRLKDKRSTRCEGAGREERNKQRGKGRKDVRHDTW